VSGSERPLGDLRLLLPAVVAWVTVAVVVAVIPDLSAKDLAGPAVAGVVLSACGGVIALRRRAQPIAMAIVVMFGSMSVAALAASIHVSALAQEPLASWAKARCDVVVEGVVTTEPQTFLARQATVWQDSQIIQAGLATTRVTCTQKVTDIQVPLLVRVKDRANLPPPGSIVSAQGRLLTSASPSSAALLMADAIEVRAGPGVLDALTHAMRMGLQKAMAHVPVAPGALVAGLAVGDDSALPPDTAQDMQSAGLSHLSAVSGENVC